MTYNSILGGVSQFFSEKIARCGPIPTGADYSSEAAQSIRFSQFIRVLDFREPFTLIDFGCGYGALAAYLKRLELPLTRYIGFDISLEMLEAAERYLPPNLDKILTSKVDEIGRADFTIASGIFNVKLEADSARWHDHILATLDMIARASVRGFAFNMLTSYSDPGRMRPDLYYGDPVWFFNYCKRRYALDIALLHDYQLYDWTMSVRL